MTDQPDTQPVTPKPSPDLQAYIDDYNRATINPEHMQTIKFLASKLKDGMPRYELVSKTCGVNPLMIGLIHMMECGFDFKKHLHNGDPLTNRTVNVPAGRPKIGTPPFTWENSAVDALTGRPKVQTTPEILQYLERYNGTGYKKRGIKTPYLWSGTSLYSKGKYVADGKYDPEAVSKQIGCAAILKYMNIT